MKGGRGKNFMMHTVFENVFLKEALLFQQLHPKDLF